MREREREMRCTVGRSVSTVETCIGDERKRTMRTSICARDKREKS